MRPKSLGAKPLARRRKLSSEVATCHVSEGRAAAVLAPELCREASRASSRLRGVAHDLHRDGAGDFMSVRYPNEVPEGVAVKYEREARSDSDPKRAPMTLAQASYLMTLCEETAEVFDDSLTQAEAVERIARLEDVTGRGRGHGV
jgi:Protein of unknown function (DUF3072)